VNIQQAIAKVINHQNLTTEEMTSVMRQLMSGGATEAQIGGFLVALRMKGESIDEIVGAVQVMRELASKVDVNQEHLIDTCGTGGDGADLFNISTAASFVVAAAGGRVAKHGNRSVSSSSGSSDVLEKSGLPLDLTPEQVARCIDEVGIGFMFAVNHHSAMKYAIGPRKELAQRTIFNMLGPMTNPASVKRQVIGVFNADLCALFAQVLQRLGSEHVLVVHAQDGLDEISLATETHVAELKDGEISEYSIKPEDFGIESQSLIGLSVESSEESLALIKAALKKGQKETGQAEKAADIIALNAGAAIYVSGVADSLKQGVAMAEDMIASGLAWEKLQELGHVARLMKATA
jgi:anthranilate phosphoribosyltransferase